MLRRILVAAVAACCLISVLACGVGGLALQRGLVSGPAFNVRVGDLELAAFTEIIHSTARPSEAYYTTWVFLWRDAPPRTLLGRHVVWGRQLIRIAVPVPIPTNRRRS